MITIQVSRFIVDCDDDYKHHIYIRNHNGIEEVTEKLTNEAKDELIGDLVYALKETLEQYNSGRKG